MNKAPGTKSSLSKRAISALFILSLARLSLLTALVPHPQFYDVSTIGGLYLGAFARYEIGNTLTLFIRTTIE